MKHNALKQETPVQAETRSDPGSGSGIPEEAQSLRHELRGLLHDRFRLAALETQRAGKSLVDIIVAGVVVGLLLTSAWLRLMTAAVLEMVEHDVVATSSALLLTVAANLLIALIFFGVIRRKSRYLQFPATLRSFQTTQSRGAAGKLTPTETTPLRTVLSFMTSIHTLYTALPLTWMMKSLHQQVQDAE